MKRVSIIQTIAILIAGSCLAHTWTAQWTPDGWTTCLGAHLKFGHVPDAEPVPGSAFLLESQAREKADEHIKVLRAQLIGEALGEPRKERSELYPEGLWHNAAMEMKREIAAEVAPASEDTKEVTVKKVKVSKNDKKILVDKEGVITIPAVAFSEKTKDAEMILVMESDLGGLQIHCPRLIRVPSIPSFEYVIDVPKAGKHALTAQVVTVHNGVSLELCVNGADAALKMAMPYTVGAWEDSQPVEVTLVEGENRLLFKGVPNSQGVSIKQFKLTPASQ